MNIFDNLTNDELNTYTYLKSYKAKDVVFNEEQICDVVGMVIYGQIDVIELTYTEKEETITILQNEAYFGDIFVNVANIAASLFLAVRTPLGFAGVAWGTVFAQYSGLALSIILLLSRYRHVFKGVGLRESMGGGRLSSFFRMNGNLFIRSVCIILVYIGFTTISARFGD